MFKRFKDKKGAVAVMAAIITTALLGFTACAVDVGMVITSRNQLQNAVDSASLAAASKLDKANQTDIMNTAKEYASYNKVLNQTVVIQDSDIAITNNTDMALRRVRVTAYRTSARGNPVNLLFARVLGHNSVDMTASSKAGLIPVNATDGIRPWAVRDRCLESGGGGNQNNNQNNNGNGNSNQNNNQNQNNNGNQNNNQNNNGNANENGNGNNNQNGNENENGNDNDNENENDEATPCTSYEYPVVGELVTMKFGPQNNEVEPYWFGPVCMPPVNEGNPQTGANAYRNLIENGYNGTVEIGDALRVEPGNMAGPTEQGVNYLTSLDPMAYWDSNTNQVMGSSYPNNQSPRIIKVVFYDPNIGIVGNPGEITVTRIGAFFLEGVTGEPNSTVTGRFIETVSTGELNTNSQSRVFGVGLIE